MTADLVEGRRVIEGQDDRVLPGSLGQPGAFRDGRRILDGAEQLRRGARSPEAHRQKIVSSVIASLELGDQRTPDRGTRQPQRVHRGLGARIAEGHLLDPGHHVAEQLGEGVFVFVALSVVCPARQRLADRRFNLVRCVAEDHGREAEHEVQVLVVIRIP